MTPEHFMQNARRINEASGYLELGMPQHALRSLDLVTDAGPLEGPHQYLRGLALQVQQRFEEAVQPLEAAAGLVPAPVAQQIWLAVTQCYQQSGRPELAVHSLANARGAQCPIIPENPLAE